MALRPFIAGCAMAVALLAATATGLRGQTGTTYYVDDSSGSDVADGTSPATAWQSLTKVSGTTFSPGDQILFKAGGSWSGQLDLNGSGTDTDPIVVDRYGTGDKPLVNGAGYSAAVLLSGVSYWEVNNLEIINDGGPTQSGSADYRVGVLVGSWSAGVRHHVYLRNLTVHDIFPETGPYGHGIHVKAVGNATRDTYFDDVRIEDCYIHRTGRYGTWVQHSGSADSNPGFKYNKNITIRDNLFENTGGSGAETGWCENVLLEGNVVDHSGASVDPRQWARGSGYWPFKCVNVLVQGNEFRHARGHADSCGVHIDFGNSDVTIQYNLSLNNEGGFVEILGDCINPTYRYNVSINDGWRVKGVDGATQDGHLIWVSDYAGSGNPRVGSVNSRIYNNTVYVAPGLTTFIKIMDESQDTFIDNNVFIIDGTVTYTNSGTNTVFDHNLWHGNLPAGLPFGSSAVFADPLVFNAGGTADGDYLLSPVSPAIAAGAVLAGNGGLDYWGNPLPAGVPCIGAHERAFSDAGLISVNLTETADPSEQIASGASYGIPAHNSRVAGWLNLEHTTNASNLPLDNGFPSTVNMTGTSPNWRNVGTAYQNTPLKAGFVNYTGSTTPATVTLDKLSASFPGGYKVIAYVCGFTSNTGASISDGGGTFHFQTLSAPASEFLGLLTQTSVAADPGDGNAPCAQYAVFGEDAPLTADTLTITLDTLYGGGTILGGFQVLAPGQFTAQGVPHGWYESFGIPIDDSADVDFDGVPAWQEFAAGTDPNDGSSYFRMLDLQRSGDDLTISWLGGATGYQGYWSVEASNNLEDWTALESQSIPRNPSGVNSWLHAGGATGQPPRFYRAVMVYDP